MAVAVAVAVAVAALLWLLEGAATCVTVSGCAVRQQRSRATGGAARGVRASVVRPGPLLCSAGRRQSRMLGIAAQGEGGCGWGCVACGCVWLCGLWLCGLWPVSFGSGSGCGCVAVWQWQWLWLFLWLQRAILLLEQLLRLPLVLTPSLPCVCGVVGRSGRAGGAVCASLRVREPLLLRYPCGRRRGMLGQPILRHHGDARVRRNPVLASHHRADLCLRAEGAVLLAFSPTQPRTQRHAVIRPRDHTQPHTVTQPHTLWPH